ncbi:hypothetical protein NKG05_18500 [Oerskovia sp. M15]
MLAPLGDDPLASRPTPAATAALARLAALDPDRVRVALVSGRRIEDLAHLGSPPAGALLVGSHGAETGEVLSPRGRRPPGHRRRGLRGRQEPGPRRRDDGARPPDPGRAGRRAGLAAGSGHRRARGDRRPVQGAWVEHKPSAAVLHTRLSPPAEAHGATVAADELGTRLGAHPMTGKNVVEIAVTSTSKGIALDTLRAALASPPCSTSGTT